MTKVPKGMGGEVKGAFVTFDTSVDRDIRFFAQLRGKAATEGLGNMHKTGCWHFNGNSSG